MASSGSSFSQEKEQPPRREKNKSGHVKEENEDNAVKQGAQYGKAQCNQNGERTESGELPLNDCKAKQRRNSSQELNADENETGYGQKTSEEPPRRNYQIPRKSKEKKELCQPITSGSREFEEVLKILRSSYLEPNSVTNFTYKKACLVHSELLEKEFTEKRRELKCDGRTDKELAESYAFLMVERAQVHNICERGLNVGHSKITILGNPSMGIYLSRYADLLQVNPLDAGATGDVLIFKIIKGKMKSIYDHMGKNALESAMNKSALDPTPKHECHVSKNANRVTSLLAYRAYELTQYYLYEYGFDELRRRPRHVCPYAVVSFVYKVEMTQVPKSLPSSRSNSFNVDRNTDKSNYILWRGQLLNKGKLLCYASLESATRPFLPFKLPEKLEVDTVMSIELLKKEIPAVFCKEAYFGSNEVVKNRMYCSLYDVVEKTRTGSNLECLLQKLEKEKLVFIKPLGDRGFLFLVSPLQMASPYEHQTRRSRLLHALFAFQEPRGVVCRAQQNSESTTTGQESHEIMPELLTFISSLHFALLQCRKDTSGSFNAVVEKHARQYLKRRAKGCSKYREFVLYRYDPRLDDKKSLYSAPRNKSHLDGALRNYMQGPEAYTLPVRKAKELIEENRVQQFSPISDYGAPEEETDMTKPVKKNGPIYETAACFLRKSSQNADYDPDRLKDLINLIQCRKKNVGGENEIEDFEMKSRLKRKLEDGSENLRKYLRSEPAGGTYQYEGERMSETSESVMSLISGLGGKDTDMRQQEFSDSPVPDIPGLIKLLFETVASSGHLNPSLVRSVNQVLGLNTDQTNELIRQKHEYKCIPVQNIMGQDHTTHVDHIAFKDPQSPEPSENDRSCISYPFDDSQVTPSEVGVERTLHIKDPNTESVSSFDGYSPCRSTPIEHAYRRQYSSSNHLGDAEMHWKLIPITGMKSPEDLLYLSPNDAEPNDPRVQSRQRTSDHHFSYSPYSDKRKKARMDRTDLLAGRHMFVTEHCQSGVIETAVLEEYSLFSRKIQDVLKINNIAYTSSKTTPVLSTQEGVLQLSEHLSLQASEISVKQYVEQLHEKLADVIASISFCNTSTQVNSTAAVAKDDTVSETALTVPVEEAASVLTSSDEKTEELSEPIYDDDALKREDSEEQHSSVGFGDAKAELCQINSKEEILQSDQNAVVEDKQEAPVKMTLAMPDNVNISATQPALSDFISQLKPEVFSSLVKIIKDVQKNTVKFYIHSEEESTVCSEIKEYLVRLGNTECHPEHFLETKAALDKLLIIIQNEDIANYIHKIPGLMTLKTLPCVSFAGVDSLDDVKNHTYNELFVSGGFVVSDESVLDPESVTIDKLKAFLKFLEELNTPDGKWQWKIHCKIQKKLKELGRMNTKALGVLTLLNGYQKKHLVDILSYHNCDSQTRNAPELDCLIRLQAQNIQQRHVVFLTEKNVSMFSSYSDNGIIVTTVEEFMQNFTSLVGYHNCATEEHCPLQMTDPQKQSGPGVDGCRIRSGSLGEGTYAPSSASLDLPMEYTIDELRDEAAPSFRSEIPVGLVVAHRPSQEGNFPDDDGLNLRCWSTILRRNAQPTYQQGLLPHTEKDEEDMSLDSEDETPHIEVCESSKFETVKTETEGLHATDLKEISQPEIHLSSEPLSGLTPDKSLNIDSENVQPVTPVSTSSIKEENNNTTEEISSKSFQTYQNRPIKMSHQFSHFNVLTHQTFLGTGMGSYPIANQNEDVNFFMSAYDQGMGTDVSSSSAGWDKK
ncbi:protein TASOR isoform X3 [Rhinatrema bivittatum]|uniref:protein TASOR isoform X3 n=1 Tax=Rhinatrema bivittatum TaxID=194408 RepID=UPI001129A100|nr:protein TASOR isoform X3 [Rhinatrema bivittatum]